MIKNLPGWTITDLMKTDCIDIDEILLKSDNKEKTKKKKEIRPLSDLVNGSKGG